MGSGKFEIVGQGGIAVGPLECGVYAIPRDCLLSRSVREVMLCYGCGGPMQSRTTEAIEIGSLVSHPLLLTFTVRVTKGNKR